MEKNTVIENEQISDKKEVTESHINTEQITNAELERISPLTLAYLGDTVYESYIREYLIRKNIFLKINDLHRKAIRYVSAHAQSKAVKGLEEYLTDEEMSVFKRGRNHKKSTAAKNASIIDYRHATGFEALIGYIYLKGDKERLDYLVDMSIKILENR